MPLERNSDTCKWDYDKENNAMESRTKPKPSQLRSHFLYFIMLN